MFKSAALLGAAFLAGLGAITTGDAADVYSRGSIKDSGPVDYRPAITWTGFYLGVHAGGVFGDEFELNQNGEVDGVPIDFSNRQDVEDTWLAGVHLGYNWQSARGVVLGVEGSWSAIGDGREAEDIGEEIFDDNWLASVRARLGYAFGPTLVYGTGGVAFLNSEDDLFDDVKTGWVAGAGVEHKVTENLSLGLEGLFYSVEDDVDDGEIASEFEREFWTVKARVTYHFGDRASEALK